MGEDTFNKFGRSKLGEYSQENMMHELLRFEEGFEADEIIDNLFLGNVSAALKLNELKRNGITHVLTIHDSLLPLYPHHFNYMVITATDFWLTELLSHFAKCFDFIEEALKSGKVLVHCAAGKSRSATVVIAYVMYKLKLGYFDAFRMVQAKRPIICPNEGFREQLQLFELMQWDYTKRTEAHIKLMQNFSDRSTIVDLKEFIS